MLVWGGAEEGFLFKFVKLLTVSLCDLALSWLKNVNYLSDKNLDDLLGQEINGKMFRE